MKQAKIIHLEESVILTLSIEALKQGKKFKGYAEYLLEYAANTINHNNKKLNNEMESKNQLGKH